MEQGQNATETPTRTRTRTAILKAAIGVLSQNPAASLGEIADTAGVARSTLHRYFPERTDLIEALHRFADDEVAAATKRARLDEGAANDALVRLCHEYFNLWSTIMWSYLQSLKESEDGSGFSEQYDPSITALIERGHRDSTIDPAVPNAWIQQVMWALLYSAWELIGQGSSRHEALTLALDSLRRLTTPIGRNGASPD